MIVLYNLAQSEGWSAVSIVLGPFAVFLFGKKLLHRVQKVVRMQNITTLPQFFQARYGNKTPITMVAIIIILFLAIPFLGVQIWYIDYSTQLMTIYLEANHAHDHEHVTAHDSSIFIWVLLIYTIFVAGKSIGRKNATDGVLLSLAIFTIFSIIVVVAGCFYVIFQGFGGVSVLVDKFQFYRLENRLFDDDYSWLHLLIAMPLAAFTFFASPWQFQLIVVENSNHQELEGGRKVFLIGLTVFSLFCFAMVLAMLVWYEGSNYQKIEFSTLHFALTNKSLPLAVLVYTVTIVSTLLLMIIELLAIANMISIDVIEPIVAYFQARKKLIWVLSETATFWIKRIAVLVTCLFGYFYFQVVPYNGFDEGILYASSTLLFQLAPGFILGLYWQRANSNGVLTGIIVGSIIWFITNGAPLAVEQGLLGFHPLANTQEWFAILKVSGLKMNDYTYGLIWSAGANIFCIIVISYLTSPNMEELLQNRLFIDSQDEIENPVLPSKHRNSTLFDLQKLVGQYVGQDIAEKRFKRYSLNNDISYNLNEFAHIKHIRYAEEQLSNAIGASSARFVMALVMERKKVGAESTIKLLDEASEFIHYNREILQSAIDNIIQGICVLDDNLKLTCWNKAFQTILQIPDAVLERDLSFKAILYYCAEKGCFGEGNVDEIVAQRIANYVTLKLSVQEDIATTGEVLHVTSAAMPEGGCVITFDNVTKQINAAKQLESINYNLELRVDKRTKELTNLNDQLEIARRIAEEANVDKTRFLAAASHDISQPMNAAMLYSTALLEKGLKGDVAEIAKNLGQSLTSVEEILVALLDISRLDSGAYKAELTDFSISELFEQLYIEFKPLAKNKGLKLRFVESNLYIRSDRSHLKRILQNYISNAIKYTSQGGVLVCIRKVDGQLRIDVYDTGDGIASFQFKTIFKEFKRLEGGMRLAQGVGLGLSIVDRIANIIDTKIEVASIMGKGSRFSCFVLAGEKEKTRRDVPKLAISRSQLSNLNVVCIDNEVEILNALKTLLSNWGINGIYVETSQDALLEIEQRNIIPDAIIVDYHLNFENGVFAIEKIRWQIEHPIIAILATADRSDTVVKVCNQKGITLMHKPIKPAVLRATLSRAGGNKIFF